MLYIFPAPGPRHWCLVKAGKWRTEWFHDMREMSFFCGLLCGEEKFSLEMWFSGIALSPFHTLIVGWANIHSVGSSVLWQKQSLPLFWVVLSGETTIFKSGNEKNLTFPCSFSQDLDQWTLRQSWLELQLMIKQCMKEPVSFALRTFSINQVCFKNLA